MSDNKIIMLVKLHPTALPYNFGNITKHDLLYCHITLKNAKLFLCADNIGNLAYNYLFSTFTLQYALSFQSCALVTHKNVSPLSLCQHVTIFVKGEFNVQDIMA